MPIISSKNPHIFRVNIPQHAPLLLHYAQQYSWEQSLSLKEVQPSPKERNTKITKITKQKRNTTQVDLKTWGTNEGKQLLHASCVNYNLAERKSSQVGPQKRTPSKKILHELF